MASRFIRCPKHMCDNAIELDKSGHGICTCGQVVDVDVKQFQPRIVISDEWASDASDISHSILAEAMDFQRASLAEGVYPEAVSVSSAIIPVVAGVGPDAPTSVNAAGGKQSSSPYRADLLPPQALLAVAKVLKHGADKYGANNWHLIPVADHINHALVHLLALNSGDASDEHLEHAATRILFALDQQLAGRGVA